MRTLAELRRWANSAPKGTTVTAEAVAGLLADLDPSPVETLETQVSAPPASWRVLLWSVDPETRIGRDELLEAVGRPVSWLYRHTGRKAAQRIPHRRMDGELVFVVGEVRRWLRDREEIVAAGPLDLTPERRIRAVR